jgi:hypothetical protein
MNCILRYCNCIFKCFKKKEKLPKIDSKPEATLVKNQCSIYQYTEEFEQIEIPTTPHITTVMTEAIFTDDEDSIEIISKEPAIIQNPIHDTNNDSDIQSLSTDSNISDSGGEECPTDSDKIDNDSGGTNDDESDNERDVEIIGKGDNKSTSNTDNKSTSNTDNESPSNTDNESPSNTDSESTSKSEDEYKSDDGYKSDKSNKSDSGSQSDNSYLSIDSDFSVQSNNSSKWVKI